MSYPGRFSLLLLLSSIILATACGAGGGEYDTTKPIVVKPDLVIGEGGRNPDLLFAAIMTFTADSQGFVYIADAIAKEIRRFDAEGRLMWKVGRKGQGPGEFEKIDYLGVGFGRVYAVDEGNERITVLDAETGAVISTHPHRGPNPAQYTKGDPLRVEAPGRIHFGVRWFVRDSTGRSLTEWRQREAMVSMDLDSGMAVRRELPFREQRPYVYTRDGQPGYTGLAVIPFEPWFVWTPNPHGGATFAWGGDYRIFVTDAEGDTLRILERAVPPRRPSADARVRAWEDLRFQLTSARASKRDLENAKVADGHPQITGLAYSRDGSQLWVQRTQFDADPIFDVFVEGEYACTVELDLEGRVGVAFFQPLVVVNGKVYQYATDRRTDVPMVVRFDLSKHPEWQRCIATAGSGAVS